MAPMERVSAFIRRNPFFMDNDTIMMAGSEAYIAALMYYNSIKRVAAENVPGAKAIYDDLKVRFEINQKKPPID